MYLNSRKRIKEHTVDLSSLYLREGAVVLVSNMCSGVPICLYERKLPDEDDWTFYTDRGEVSPHDIIHITRRNGVCRIYFNPDDQERECTDVDFKKKKLQKTIDEGETTKLLIKGIEHES